MPKNNRITNAEFLEIDDEFYFDSSVVGFDDDTGYPINNNGILLNPCGSSFYGDDYMLEDRWNKIGTKLHIITSSITDDKLIVGNSYYYIRFDFDKITVINKLNDEFVTKNDHRIIFHAQIVDKRNQKYKEHYYAVSHIDCADQQAQVVIDSAFQVLSENKINIETDNSVEMIQCVKNLCSGIITSCQSPFLKYRDKILCECHGIEKYKILRRSVLSMIDGKKYDFNLDDIGLLDQSDFNIFIELIKHYHKYADTDLDFLKVANECSKVELGLEIESYFQYC